MDIRVGKVAPVRSETERAGASSGHVEARLLAVRAPRKRRDRGEPPAVERRSEPQERPDPVGGKVLVLLVPDGTKIPPGFEEGQYRVFLRFARR